MGCKPRVPLDPTVLQRAPEKRTDGRRCRVTFAAHHLLLLGETVQGSHLADEGLGGTAGPTVTGGW